jgi:gamma-glutamylcyclotransferase (GGCT)/AIG2-like uncharacterized protein YtfP
MILAVYGNFREGEPLSHYLEHLRERGKIVITTICGIKLHVFGQAPGAVVTNAETDHAVMEIIEADVSAKEEAMWLRILDHVEGVGTGMYERAMISTPIGMAYIYVCKLPTKGLPVITDWLEWKKRPMKEKVKAFNQISESAMFVTLRS